MKAIKKIAEAVNSRSGSFIFFTLALSAFTFFYSSDWAYGFIIELYPLGNGFITLMFCLTGAAALVSLISIIINAFTRDRKQIKGIKIFYAIHIIFAIIGIITFIYTFALLFGLDKGITASGFQNGFSSLLPNIGYLGTAVALGLALTVVSVPKKAAKALIACVLILALIISPIALAQISTGAEITNAPEMNIQSENLLTGAKIVYESLKKGEKADAVNLIDDSKKCWTEQDPQRTPEEGHPDANNSYVEIELDGEKTFNTAVIEEDGNEAQYFRLQALVGDEWTTIYQSEKIQAQRLCSFDPVTTSRIRLSIDKFRDSDTPVKIKSIKIYNEEKRNADNFEVTAYQRLDGDVPTEILARGAEYVSNYARFYDVYSTIIVFGAVSWDENGNMSFGEGGEENFARQIEALKEIIAHCSNPDHEVKLIVTALADGTWGDEHNGVNAYMGKYWESIADKIVAFVEKYEFDGVDIDWEYPQTAEDWKCFDNFIERLDEGLKKQIPILFCPLLFQQAVLD